MLRRLLYILIAAILTIGCGETLKSGWSNLRAYYNTYYNAKKHFRSGLSKVQEQPVALDPREAVPVHPTPPQAGNEDFELAIEKGAEVLRNYSDSKWTDNALLLIGKSYYYQQEYYPALQKFEELQNVSPDKKMQQLAIIWKGKALLAAGLFSEGVSYLESELNRYSGEYFTRNAEIQVLAGEHHAMLENWGQAAEWLSLAIANIEDKKLLGRTFFLYGQVLERSKRYGEAYYAFSRVSENFPGFEYAYWASVKRADVARKDGNLDLAISIYENLWRDDKNFQRRDELTFEIARTLEMKGDIARASELYNNLLNSGQSTQQRGLRSDIYYRLGEINSDRYNNYDVAAAYFDSSSATGDANKAAGESIDAQTLAKVYGKHANLQETIQRADSLLWLGSLSSTALDSVIEQIRIRKRSQLLKQQAESEEKLFNLGSERNSSQTVSSIYGFLNHRNAELVKRAKAEFRVIWGNRPLVDNWRRMEVVQQSTAGSSAEQNDNLAASNNSTARAFGLNLDEIPTTEEEIKALQTEKAAAQYELGNLLFLSLNSPDSARHYFYQVINSRVGLELRPMAMYSLYELFNSENRIDSLKFWERQILKEYPDTKYARRIHSRMNKLPGAGEAVSASSKLTREYHQLINSNKPYKADKLRSLALDNHSSRHAPYIYYQAIVAYISRAKVGDKLSKVFFSSTNGDSPLQNALSGGRYFNSVYWDSVRFALQEFDTAFSNTPLQQKTAKLREMLEQPSSPVKVPTCESLGVKLSVKSGMKEFLSSVKFSEKVKKMSVSGQVTYSFVVTPAGEVESFQLISNKTSLGIEEAFEASFDSLRFLPISLENPPEKMRCEVDFPVRM